MLHDRWVALALLFLARTAMAIQFQTVGALGPLLVRDIGIDYARLGTLIGLYMLPGVLLALPGGVLIQRFGASATAYVELAAMAIGGELMGLSSAYPVLATGRLISGAGAVLLNVALTKMVADWFARREIVTAMAILVSSWPLGIALCLVLFVPLAESYGWQAIMHVGAIACLLALLMIFVGYRPPPDAPAAQTGRFTLTLTRHEWLLASLAGLIWATFNVGYIVLVSFAPALFVERGYSLVQASWIVSLAGWALIASIPVSGLVAEGAGRARAVMIASFVVAGAAASAMPFVASPVAALIVCIAVIGAPAGPVMALPAGALRPEARAAGMGVFYTWYYLGMAMLPGIAGYWRDRLDSVAVPLLFVGLMMMAALVCLLAFLAAANRRKEAR